MWMRTLLFLAFANFCWLSVAGSAAAADANADTDSDALAKKVQNPIANLVRDSHREDFNLFVTQYFLNYNLGSGVEHPDGVGEKSGSRST